MTLVCVFDAFQGKCIVWPPSAPLPCGDAKDLQAAGSDVSDEDVLACIEKLLEAIGQEYGSPGTLTLRCTVTTRDGRYVPTELSCRFDGSALSFDFWDMTPHHSAGHAVGSFDLERGEDASAGVPQANSLRAAVLEHLKNTVDLGECRVDFPVTTEEIPESVEGKLFLWRH